MGCFLGCFGISTKRKRRKPANRILPGPGDSKFVSYEPLDSSDSTNVPITSNSQLSNKPKEKLSIKIRKKVSFNLNVQTYEPIPAEETTTYQFLQSVEEEESEKNGAEAGKGSLALLSEGDSNSLQTGSSYPNNYRYQNCRESYDEEDEMTYEESDLEDDDYFYDYDDDDDDYGDGDKDVDDQTQRREEILHKFDSLSMESAKGASLIQLDEDKSKNQMPLGCGNARIRSQYLCSVLNPIENTNQWKEIKARAAAAPPKQRRKENIAVEEEPEIPFSSKLRSNFSPNYNQSKPLLQDIAVDASLSNWLISPNTTDESKTKGSTKSCSFGFDTWSREDRVILDITNLEAL